MPYPYAGKYIRFDLGTGRYSVEPISDDDVKTYLLGSGYAAKLFHDELDASIDPLDPRATLYIFNGLLSGTFAPTGCRSSWCGARDCPGGCGSPRRSVCGMSRRPSAISWDLKGRPGCRDRRSVARGRTQRRRRDRSRVPRSPR